MKLGSLITPSCATVHMYNSIELHPGEYVSPFSFGDFGIVIETGISPWDVQYLKILTQEGKTGWVRREKVEVLR